MHSAVSPRYAPIPRACEISGIGRSSVYKLASQGHIRLIKVGNRTLVDLEHLSHWMETLPLANIARSPASKSQ
jgi:excisionase family DNA binding protein